MDFISFPSRYILASTRRYLNRKEDRIISKDDSTFVVEIGKKSELRDVMDAQKRSVTLGFQLNDSETIAFHDRIKLKQKEKTTGWLEAMKSIRWALDAAGNTGQYIRYTNMKIEQHNEEIKNITLCPDAFKCAKTDDQVKRILNPRIQELLKKTYKIGTPVS